MINLGNVSGKLQNYGLKVNEAKPDFFLRKWSTVVMLFDEGLHKSESKVETVRSRVPQPQSITQLKAFLGMVIY